MLFTDLRDYCQSLLSQSTPKLLVSVEKPLWSFRKNDNIIQYFFQSLSNLVLPQQHNSWLYDNFMSLFNCKELRPIAKSYAKTKETDGKGTNKYELESNMPKWMAKAAPNPFWWLMSHISSSLASFFGLRFGPSQQDTDRQTVFGCWSQLIPSPCQLMKMFKNDHMCTSLLEWKKNDLRNCWKISEKHP